MQRGVYRFAFDKTVNIREAEETLMLAVMAVESLFGEPTVRLEASYSVDAAGHVCVVDVGNDVGRFICRVFTGYITREFGCDAFEVQRSASSRPEGAGRCAAAG